MKRYKILAWLMTGIVFTSLLFWLGVQVVVMLRRSSVEQSRIRLTTLTQRRDTLQKAEELQEEWIRVPDVLDQFYKNTISPFAEFPAFRDQLQRQISGSGLSTLKFTYRMRPVQNNLQRVTLEFSLSGPYAAVKRFVHQTEAQREMVYLKSIQMRKTPEGIVSNFSMEAFFAR